MVHGSSTIRLKLLIVDGIYEEDTLIPKSLWHGVDGNDPNFFVRTSVASVSHRPAFWTCNLRQRMDHHIVSPGVASDSSHLPARAEVIVECKVHAWVIHPRPRLLLSTTAMPLWQDQMERTLEEEEEEEEEPNFVV